MTFPEVSRARYEINVLDEVVCRLKFPPILKIDTEPPAAFQETVRATYPFYQVRAATKLPANMPPEVAQLIQHDPAFAGTRTHWFGSSDRYLWAGLTRDGLSLHCRRYRRWEDFLEQLLTPFEALIRAYAPPFFVHSCMRYRNSISRQGLPDPAAPWSHWLSPWVCGPLGSVEAAGQVESLQTRALFRLSDDVGHVDATYGLAEKGDLAEELFLIDAHVYTETHLEPDDVPDRLAALHEQARRFFRWCITDALHRALGPGSRPLGGG